MTLLITVMAANQQFCLRWNNHQRTLISVFDSLLESGTLVDCTLAAEGQYLNAHKVVLSACSPYLGVSKIFSISIISLSHGLFENDEFVRPDIILIA